MSYTFGSSGSIRLTSGRFPSRASTKSSASSSWSSTGSDRISIFAKPASATLSLSQSMMYRPSIAPSRTGTISGIGELLRIIPPTCWLSSFGAPINCGASSISSRHPHAPTRWLNAGSCSISSRNRPASCERICFESSPSSSCGSPSALPKSRSTPLILYVAIAPASTAYSGPNRSCTRSINSSRSARGKSRSMSGNTVVSSDKKRSSVRLHFSGSI